MTVNPESKLQLRIRKGLEQEFGDDIYIFKEHGGRYSHGVPDLVGCYEGTFIGLEVKVPGHENRVTKLQQSNLDRIEKAGGIAAVVSSLKQAREALNGDSS